MDPFAKALRRDATDAEKRLWHHLRNRNLAGQKFRRQHPIGPYIVDFVCIERRLIIELDGGQHADQVAYDATRTAFLERKGFTVTRFWDDQVLKETQAVLSAIFDALAAPSPRPSPPDGGEGACCPSPAGRERGG